MKSYRKILIFIVIAQFFCTSLWFAGNGIIAQLIEQFELSKDALAYLTSSVQFGFITGTLLYALLTITDRFSPSKVFMISAFCGAVFNLGVIWDGNSLTTLLVFRFLTGFFLAGIYPVGMKIATDYFDKGLGKSLGFLVGALVIGTAFPHLLSDILKDFSWKIVLISTSVLATIGGLLIFLFVPDGPFRKAGQQLDLSAIFKVFKNKRVLRMFRAPPFPTSSKARSFKILRFPTTICFEKDSGVFIGYLESFGVSKVRHNWF